MSVIVATPPRRRPTLPANIRTALARISRKHLNAQIWRFPLLAAIFLPLYWLVQALVDLGFNLSWGVRAGCLAVAAVVVVGLFVRYVVLPFRRRLSLRSAALLAERKFPRFRTSLISAVDFTMDDGRPTPPHSLPLIDALLREVDSTVGREEIVRGIVDTRPLKKLFRFAAVAAAVVAGLVWFFQPGSLVLARRIFLSHDVLPSRTTVVPLTADFTLDVGSNVELAARAQGVVPRNGRLAVIYADGRKETLPVSANPAEPGVFRITLRNVLQSFRYHFEINDGASADSQVKTRLLPSLASIKFTYQPPSYTHLPNTELPSGGLTLLAESRLVIDCEATQPLQSATLELKGLDQKLRMDNGDPVHNLNQHIEDYEAKAKTLQSQADKLRPDLDSATAGRDAAQKAFDEADRVRKAAPQGDERRRLDFKCEVAGDALRDAQGAFERAKRLFDLAHDEWEAVQREITGTKKYLDGVLASPRPGKEEAAKQKRVLQAVIPIPKEGLNGLSIHLVNEEGLASVNDPVYRVNITLDKPPTVEITEPKAERKTVLAGDKVLVKFRARDDYRIERIDMHYILLRPNADGVPAPAEEQTLKVPFPEGATTVAGEYLMDVGSFVPPMIEGCSISYWFVASDYFTLYNNGGGVSRKMILAVVSPEEKKAELIAEMQKTARAIQHLAERQGKANEKTDANLRK